VLPFDEDDDAAPGEYGGPDPEANLPDPAEELPNVPEPPESPSPLAESDVPSGLLRAFWTTVALLNVAVMLLAVGAMMVGFDVHRTLGAAFLVVGLLSLYRGLRRYRSLQQRQADGTLAAGDDDAGVPEDNG